MAARAASAAEATWSAATAAPFCFSMPRSVTLTCV